MALFRSALLCMCSEALWSLTSLCRSTHTHRFYPTIRKLQRWGKWSLRDEYAFRGASLPRGHAAYLIVFYWQSNYKKKPSEPWQGEWTFTDVRATVTSPSYVCIPYNKTNNASKWQSPGILSQAPSTEFLVNTMPRFYLCAEHLKFSCLNDNRFTHPAILQPLLLMKGKKK